jgi:hypothetical protein
MNTAVTVDVLSGVSDSDGETFTVTGVTPGTHGTAQLNADGTVTYTPNAGFAGTDSFTYTVSDSSGTTSAQVNVTVGAPVANGTTVMTPKNTLLNINLSALVSDQSTPPANLTYTVGNVQNGTVTLLGDGHTAQFTPNTSFHGFASFNFTVTDPNTGLSSDLGTVTIPVNSNPSAMNGFATTAAGTATTVLVLANATDPDGDSLTVQSVTQPAHGSVSIVSGTAVYTPNANFSGTDSFQYTVSDGFGGYATASVNVTVLPNSPPPPPPPPPPPGQGSVTGFVWNDVNANGIEDPTEGSFGTSLQVNLLDMSGHVVATTWTMFGMYSFGNINNGQYRVQIILPTGYAFSPEYQPSGTADNSDVDANGLSATLTVNGMTFFDINAGVHSA